MEPNLKSNNSVKSIYIISKLKKFIITLSSTLFSLINTLESGILAFRTKVFNVTNLVGYKTSRVIFVFATIILVAFSSHCGSKSVESFQQSILMPLFGKYYYMINSAESFLVEELFSFIVIITTFTTMGYFGSENLTSTFLIHGFLFFIIFALHGAWGFLAYNYQINNAVQYLIMLTTVILHSMSTAIRDITRVEVLGHISEDLNVKTSSVLNARKQLSQFCSFCGSSLIIYLGSSYSIFGTTSIFEPTFTTLCFILPAVMMFLNILLFYPIKEKTKPTEKFNTEIDTIIKEKKIQDRMVFFTFIEDIHATIKKYGLAICLKRFVRYIRSSKGPMDKFLYWNVLYHILAGIRKNILITRYSYLIQDYDMHVEYIDYIKNICYWPSMVILFLFHIEGFLPEKFTKRIYSIYQRIVPQPSTVTKTNKNSIISNLFNTILTLIPIVHFYLALYLICIDFSNISNPTWTSTLTLITSGVYLMSIIHRTISITHWIVFAKDVSKNLASKGDNTLPVNTYEVFVCSKTIAISSSNFILTAFSYVIRSLLQLLSNISNITNHTLLVLLLTTMTLLTVTYFLNIIPPKTSSELSEDIINKLENKDIVVESFTEINKDKKDYVTQNENNINIPN